MTEPATRLHQCAGCSHRRPNPPLTGWAIARRAAWITGLALLGITLLFGIIGWAALIVTVAA